MKIRLRLSSSRDAIGYAIKLFTWSEWTHVDFLLDDGRYLGAIPLKGVIIHTLPADRERFLEIDVTKRQHDKILEFAMAQLGKPYDYSAIFGFLLRRNWQEDDSWFCSELVATSFIAAGKRLFDETANKISPRDISINAAFREIPRPSFAK